MKESNPSLHTHGRSIAAWALFLSALPVSFLRETDGFAWLALWPSAVALGIVLLTRHVLPGLIAGALAGAIMLAAGDPLTGFFDLIRVHFLPLFASTWKVGALVFTLLMGGFVALIERGGGLNALVHRIAHGKGNPARRTQMAGFGLGVICFFDGLANSMMVGRILRPIADRTGVSRARLAYLVDSTSSCIACVAFVSTWIAYQLSMIQEGFNNAGLPDAAEPYALFFQSIPYNFYCWFTIALLLAVIWRNWNIGPMRHFEAGARDALKSTQPEPAQPASGEPSTPHQSSPGLWRAIVPIAVLVIALLGGLYLDGMDKLRANETLNVAEQLTPMQQLAQAYSQADAAFVMVCSSIVAALAAFLLFPRGRRRNPAETQAPGSIFMEGVLTLFAPALILISAWMLGSVLDELEASAVLSAMLGESLPVWLLPVVTFLIGALISFSTGTAWGTMAILMPLAIPVTLSLAGVQESSQVAAQATLLGSVIAAVFSGAVFGDHCSPISDTTIVSSIASGIEPMDHVRTQIPYALIAAGLAALAGFVPAGLGLAPWLSLLAGLAVILALVLLVRPPAAPPANASTPPLPAPD